VNLHAMLVERQAAGRPVTVGLIGAGKFGTMFASQVRLTDAMHLVALADLDVSRARRQLRTAGWNDESISAPSLGNALARGNTHVTEDTEALIACPEIEVIVEATGVPAAGIRHALSAIRHGKHIVMVNVEADALAGPLLAAGKGTRYEPHYHRSTPDTVWDILDKYLSITDRNSINPKMFNSFIDGTKSGIEMTAVCNATGLLPQSGGLGFPPATRFELADVCKPKAAGGTLERAGVTEVASSVYRDGRDVPHHLALGTYVVFEGESEYARRCFKEYAMLPDKSGRYAALYRPIHMIGLELGVSVASVALRKEPTGAPTGFRSDVAATAKRTLKQGEVLDGEGGFCVWGKQVPAARSLAEGLLPLGLAHEVRLKRDVAEGQCLRWSDVDYDENTLAVKVRREMEAAFGRPNEAGDPSPG